MNLLCYNCRGLGNDPAVVRLKKLLRREKPDVMILLETKLRSEEMKALCRQLGDYHVLSVDPLGRAGGIALLWQDFINVSYLSSTQHHIDVAVEGLFGDDKWRLTGFYGWAATEEKYLSWELLRGLKEVSDLPWLVVGDFNQIFFEHEKAGGPIREQRVMDEFREAVDDCGLKDLGYVGECFTWWNKQGDENCVKERLDRAVASTSWIAAYPLIIVKNLSRDKSDHNPLLLTRYTTPRRTKKRRFRFENMWTMSENCEGIIKRAWTPDARHEDGDVLGKIKSCSTALLEWSRIEFGNLNKKIEETRKRMMLLDSCFPTEDVVSERRVVCKQLDDLLLMEEAYWKQRARVTNLSEGDQNTKFFHIKASGRKKRNYINRILNDEGVWVEDTEEIGEVAWQFFNNLFAAESCVGVDEVASCVRRNVTDEMNACLMRAFSSEEVYEALMQMHPNKAPGPDGLNAKFFQQYWHVIGNDISQLVIDCLNGRVNMALINSTHIVLIPKSKNPHTMAEFRPISLCNVVYKLVSKVLANRLKPLLGGIISEEQSAFIPDRLIPKNGMIAFEVFHFMKSYNFGAKGYMALKLDMSKAYDRVEWNYLDTVMRKMGFCDGWVTMIMRCLTTVSSSVLVNGNCTKALSPRRGLRQGDPISPFLFIIYTEAFSRLLSREVERKTLSGVQICRSAPRISHLLFADDSISFCKADESNVSTVNRILNDYQKASGQRINWHKSEVFYSANVGDDPRERLTTLLGAKIVQVPGKYLGLPAIVGRNKTMLFSTIREKIWKKMKGWKEKLLSFAGREVVIKAVAQSIPTYHMGLFKLPLTLVHDIEMDVARFWWGFGEEKRKIYWVAWDKLCTAKKDGGLGFRHLSSFNIAMLAKQGWRLMEYPNSLAAKLLKARYYPACNFLEAKLGHHPSYIWRSILEGQEVLQKGCRWLIGDGRRVRAWQDKWTLSAPTFRLISPTGSNMNEKVCEGIDDERGGWRTNLVKDKLLPFEAEDILRIPISTNSPDKLVWHFSNDGNYTVKSGYHFLRWSREIDRGGVGASSDVSSRFWKFIWSLNVPPKVRSFLWRACSGAIPSGANIQSRVDEIDPTCTRCSRAMETDMHALLFCSEIVAVWEGVGVHPEDDWGEIRSIREWVAQLLEKGISEEKSEELIVILWNLWNDRNSVFHGGAPREAWKLIDNSRCLCKAYQEAQASKKLVGGQEAGKLERWLPPVEGTFKLNVDGAIFGDQGCGLGFVLRGWQGDVLLAGCQHIQEKWEPVYAEARALEFGLRTVNQQGYRRIVVESDCLQLVSLLKRDVMPSSYLGNIGKEILGVMQDFESVVVSHIRRGGNQAAHYIAHLAPIDYSCRVWLCGGPEGLLDVVAADYMSAFIN